jgi:hypothetical protein
MDRVALLVESCLVKVFDEKASAGTVTDVPTTLTVKEKLLALVPFLKPAFEGKQGILTQVDHSAHAVLFSLEEMNLPVLDVQVIQSQAQGFPDPDPCP